jgi:hypothetical protein
LFGRTPAEAVGTFIAQFQHVVACITQAVIGIRGPSGYQPATEPHVAALNRGLPVSLQGPTSLRLQVTLLYTVVRNLGKEPWRVQIAGYIYAIRKGDNIEVLAYHWHPRGTSRVTWPHLHVGAANSPPVLPRTHLPTGHVPLQDIVRLVIEELGVEARRDDWREVVVRTRQALGEAL